MIKADSLAEIGAVIKPHGIKGEFSAEIDVDPTELRCLVFDIDGIYVPFFVDTARRRGSQAWLVKLDGVADEKQAAEFSGKDIYALREEIADDEADGNDGFYLYDLCGYKLFDDDIPVGEIVAVDDSTANILLHVSDPSGNTIFVPFAEELIVAIDTERKTITMNLPEGIIDLN